jgi:hypothetical protein
MSDTARRMELADTVSNLALGIVYDTAVAEVVRVKSVPLAIRDERFGERTPVLTAEVASDYMRGTLYRMFGARVTISLIDTNMLDGTDSDSFRIHHLKEASASLYSLHKLGYDGKSNRHRVTRRANTGLGEAGIAVLRQCRLPGTSLGLRQISDLYGQALNPAGADKPTPISRSEARTDMLTAWNILGVAGVSEMSVRGGVPITLDGNEDYVDITYKRRYEELTEEPFDPGTEAEVLTVCSRRQNYYMAEWPVPYEHRVMSIEETDEVTAVLEAAESTLRTPTPKQLEALHTPQSRLHLQRLFATIQTLETGNRSFAD